MGANIKKLNERQEKSGKYDRRKAKRFRKRACPEAARHFRPAILPLSKIQAAEKQADLLFPRLQMQQMTGEKSGFMRMKSRDFPIRRRRPPGRKEIQPKVMLRTSTSCFRKTEAHSRNFSTDSVVRNSQRPFFKHRPSISG